MAAYRQAMRHTEFATERGVNQTPQQKLWGIVLAAGEG